jgi:hypothetical protein
MQISVLVEPVAGNGYRARGLDPSTFCAEGSTLEEALENLKKLMQERLRAGGRVVSLEVTAAEHPLTKVAGIFDPANRLVQEWKRIMAENRKQADEDPELP